MEIRVLLNILYRRRAIIALVLVSFLLLVGLITLLAPKSYEATAKITVENPDKISAITTGLGLQGLVLDTRVDDDVSLDTDIELLMIRPLVERLITEMNLRDSAGEYLETDDFIDGGFKSKLKGQPAVSVEQYNDTALISITANSPSPEQAAAIANRLAAMYKEERIARTREDFGEVKKVIDKSLTKMREDYYKKLSAYKEFKQRTGVVNLDTSIESLLNQIAELENNRADYQRSVAAFNETINISRQQLEKTEKIWESGQELGENSLVVELKQKLAGLSTELSGLNVTVTENHPDYKNLNAQADTVMAILQREPVLSTSRKQLSLNPVYESLYRSVSDNLLNLKGMLARLETVEKQLAEYKQKLLTLPALQVDNSKLSMELSVNSTLYSSLLQYALEVGLAESAAVAKIRLVEPAKVPDSAKPKFPKKAVNLILGIILGSFFALAAALVIDYADGSVRDARDLRCLSDKPHLGVVPYSSTLQGRSNAMPPVCARVTESLRSIRDVLLFEAGEQHARSGLFVVTAAMAGGGASTVATGLARVLAEKYGETLLVDLNLRSPALAGLAGTTTAGGGVAQALQRGGTLEDHAIKSAPVEGLALLPAGTVQDEPGKLLDGQALPSLLTELRQRFRHVVIDTPPCALYNDAAVIAGHADGVVFVVRAAATPAPLVAACFEKLRIVGNRLVGTVLNDEGYSLALHRLPWVMVMFFPELLRAGLRRLKHH